jgi:hypothetical protein
MIRTIFGDERSCAGISDDREEFRPGAEMVRDLLHCKIAAEFTGERLQGGSDRIFMQRSKISHYEINYRYLKNKKLLLECLLKQYPSRNLSTRPCAFHLNVQ